ncbi:GNAT family N-acetyltransferase [Sphingobacterium micropteri]|uniref:GNAT family N-acetyltransferase n=1 Tax=Sphingobacterium micropteri TaxID=2763501 RepID=UPI001CC300E9|nr:GNAT family N-acetyltransferase [Sphingobacterium micropteri]
MPLYEANAWSAAQKPVLLLKGLINSHSLITAWDGDIYPHLLVLPSYQGKGIGHLIMDKMQEIYKDFHMQMLTADGKAIDFYKKEKVNGNNLASLKTLLVMLLSFQFFRQLFKKLTPWELIITAKRFSSYDLDDKRKLIWLDYLFSFIIVACLVASFL